MALGYIQKGRPPQLSLSPSDPALAANAKSATDEQHFMEDDRGVLSDVGYSLAVSFFNAKWDPTERCQECCDKGPWPPVWTQKLVVVNRQHAIASQVSGGHHTTVGHFPTQRWWSVSAATTKAQLGRGAREFATEHLREHLCGDFGQGAQAAPALFCVSHTSIMLCILIY